jgi:hypothetical protein
MRSSIAMLACLSFLHALAGPEARANDASLRGGRRAMAKQNRACDADDLTRLQDLGDLEDFIAEGRLVRVTDTRSYYLDGPGSLDKKHAASYRYARRWTKDFLDKELGKLKRKFGVRAKVTSLVRTQAYQDRICRSGNGAAICGDEWWEVSSHLTGATVDVSKAGMTKKAKAWFRKRLLALERAGKVDAIEEAGAFHVLVRKSYSPDPPKKRPRRKKTRD